MPLRLVCSIGAQAPEVYRFMNDQTVAIKGAEPNPEGLYGLVASKSRLNEETQSFIDLLGRASFVQVGSSLKFCRVTEGGADIYPRLASICEWDTAAAPTVLEGSGGAVVDLRDRLSLYRKPDILNPPFIATRDISLLPV